MLAVKRESRLLAWLCLCFFWKYISSQVSKSLRDYQSRSDRHEICRNRSRSNKKKTSQRFLPCDVESELWRKISSQFISFSAPLAPRVPGRERCETIKGRAEPSMGLRKLSKRSLQFAIHLFAVCRENERVGDFTHLIINISPLPSIIAAISSE
jgi:hypothetical protein